MTKTQDAAIAECNFRLAWRLTFLRNRFCQSDRHKGSFFRPSTAPTAFLPAAIEKTDMDPMLAGHFTNGESAFERGFYNPGAKGRRVGPSAFSHNLDCCMVSPDIRCDRLVFILDKIVHA